MRALIEDMEIRHKKASDSAKDLKKAKRENRDRIKEIMNLKKDLQATRDERDQFSYQAQDQK
jgi:hypothetical protein